ncbi:hypothetical protein N7454_010230 [Penicillium verhagenii]|nr:hypothetical protein N7454_010230 [Penicillium verhagenii]
MTTEAKRKAIVMDCEMVEVQGADYSSPSWPQLTSSPARLSSTTTCSQGNQSFTGTPNTAAGKRQEIGCAAFADTDTVLIGHALFNDLQVLRFAHLKIVDSSVLACSAVFPDQPPEKSVPRSWSLKCLAKELLGYRIQGGWSGHSAMEDSRATRDLVMFCLEEPEKLREWAVAAREVEDKLMAKRERSRERAKAAREKMEKEAREHTARKQAASRQDPWGD